MAVKNYKGKKITGTSTTAKVFKKSGLKVKKGHPAKKDTYRNTQTGHMYQCTKGGEPKNAKWKYTNTIIIAKPDTAVESLSAPERTTVDGNNRYMKSTWKVPDTLKDSKNGKRAENEVVEWNVNGLKVSSTLGQTATESQINLNSFKVGNTTYNRNSFYPYSTTKLTSVSVTVNPKNSKGNGSKPQTQTRAFYTPRTPELADLAFNGSTGIVSVVCKTNAGDDYYERVRTRYKVTVTNTRTDGEPISVQDTSSTSTEFTISFDASDYQQLSFDEYIKVEIEAWAQGYAGDSGKAKETFYVAYPAQATIEDIEVTSRDSGGKCTVFIATNHTEEHPVDKVKLEYMANCTYKESASIPGDASWSSSDIEDNAQCTALSLSVTNLIPDPGKYTWMRVMSYHAAENVLYRYSNYMRVYALETPIVTAADDDIVIISAITGGDGKSAVVHLGWNADGEDDSTGTELTWSEEEDTWKSTDEPDIHEFTWSDGPVYKLTEDTYIQQGKTYFTRSGSGTDADPYVYTEVQSPSAASLSTYYEVEYYDSATIVIKGLDEATKYYIRARRYLEDDIKTWSPYSNQETVITSETPDVVMADCASYIPEGASLPITWTFTGNGLQTQWQIIERIAVTENNTTTIVDGAVIAEGEGSRSATQIDAERLAEFAVDNQVMLSVHVSTGSGFVQSEDHLITIVEPPTMEITVPATLTAQPFAFIAASNRECDLTIIVSAQGVSGQYPDGIHRQTNGDTVYSDVISPIWAPGNDGLTATIQIPAGLDFWDGALYSISVVATDRQTGLQCEVDPIGFAVNWTNKAVSLIPEPEYEASLDTEVDEDKTYYQYADEQYTAVDPEGTENPSQEGWYEPVDNAYIHLTPIDEVDENDWHHQAVKINLTPPTGCSATDVYDIYRMTGDGAYPIGIGFPLTYEAVDEYAPFGDALTLYYRIALRTVDGSISYADFEYAADGDALRIDWRDGILELPYDIAISSKYKKDVEVRNHLDGSRDAYWNGNIEHNDSLNSDLIRLESQEDVNLARQLGHFAGAVFVRTPEGEAYEANVQISDMSTTGLFEAIAIDAEEIGITDEFILPTPFTAEEEEEE